MKRILVLVAIAALVIGAIPFVDSSDAAGETTISGYFKGGDVSSSTKIVIAIIYSEDGGDNGTLAGIAESINPPDNTGKNKFTVTITPGAHLEMEYYYIYIEILGYDVTRYAKDNYQLKETPISVTDPRTSNTQQNKKSIISFHPIFDVSQYVLDKVLNPLISLQKIVDKPHILITYQSEANTFFLLSYYSMFYYDYLTLVSL